MARRPRLACSASNHAIWHISSAAVRQRCCLWPIVLPADITSIAVRSAIILARVHEHIFSFVLHRKTFTVNTGRWRSSGGSSFFFSSVFFSPVSWEYEHLVSTQQRRTSMSKDEGFLDSRMAEGVRGKRDVLPLGQQEWLHALWWVPNAHGTQTHTK